MEYSSFYRKRNGFLKKVVIGLVVIFTLLRLTGVITKGEPGQMSNYLTAGNLPNFLLNELGLINEKINGRNYTIRTFSNNGNVIDVIKGASVYISSDERFDQTNSSGDVISKSSVIEITIGENSMTHTGSTLVAYEDGIVDVFDEYAKTHDISNDDRSTPIVNSMVNSFKNNFNGKPKLVLVRSQAGEPIATFVGESVSYFDTEIAKTTNILIDGKSVFLYKCDYSIYDINLLN